MTDFRSLNIEISISLSKRGDGLWRATGVDHLRGRRVDKVEELDPVDAIYRVMTELKRDNKAATATAGG